MLDNGYVRFQIASMIHCIPVRWNIVKGARNTSKELSYSPSKR